MAVITISRQFGAGGLTLGKKIAERLGYAFYDNEILQQISEKANVSESWVKSIEREAGGKIHQTISNLVPRRVIDRILSDEHGYIDETIYLDLLQQIIHAFAAKGNSVILGRGGQYILRDQKDAFHVLLIAEKRYRIQFIEAKYNLRPPQARQVVNAEDKRRKNLYRKFHKTNFDSPSLYHMTLNMSILTLDQALRTICIAVADT
ncbi:MAG: cytidylate kinase-like family protein [Desulfobacteraceae bacterium]|nr:cytidylate kinase-like family protein [Desulfobacteraceae bacterium]